MQYSGLGVPSACLPIWSGWVSGMPQLWQTGVVAGSKFVFMAFASFFVVSL